MHIVPRRHHVSMPLELIPSPEPAPFKLYEGPVRRGPVLKPTRPFIFRKPPARMGSTSTGHQGADIDNPLYDGIKSRPVSKPVKPVVHPSVVSWMEEWSRQSKIRGAEERLRQEEARRLREKAYTENVYTELHLMELINEHTGNK